MFSGQNTVNPNHQKGLALLILVIAILLAVVTYTVSSLSIKAIEVEQARKTLIALNKAKQALINHAITHMDITTSGEMGYLPCPDVNDVTTTTEGDQDVSCGTEFLNSIGYLPWRTLKLPVLRDGAGACLMYAVSNTYKQNPSSMLNDDSNGLFQVVDDTTAVIEGGQPEDRIVAIVFAPGAVLTGQTRNVTDNTTACGKDYGNMNAYLEGDGVTDNGVLSVVNNDIDQFIHSTITSADGAIPYNDSFVTISRNDIWSAILARSDYIARMKGLTEALAVCIANYANNVTNTNRRLPWPVAIDLGGLKNYRKNNSYDDEANAVSGYAGRYPFIVDSSNNILGFPVSPPVINKQIFEMGFCNNIDLPSTIPIENINLEADQEYRRLWENWKDHFFYVLSKDYEPGIGGEVTCGNCNDIGGISYSGIVIFGGIRLALDFRAEPYSGDNDDKAGIANYLENGNELTFPVANGNNTYSSVNPDPTVSNDIMFCISDEDTDAMTFPLPSPELSVSPC